MISGEVQSRRKSVAAAIRAALLVPDGLADSEKRPDEAVDRNSWKVFDANGSEGMKIKSDVYINLTEEELWKLDVIQSSFEEQVTRKTMIGEFINSAFGSALKVLYEADEITEEGLEDGLEHLPEYLQDVYRKRIAAPNKDK